MEKSDPKVKTFYGSSAKRTNKHWEQKKIKLEKCASDFRRNPILPSRKLRIDDPHPVFETFPRQQMAFDYVRTCHQDVHVFAKEKDFHGKRVYIVATLPQFWYKYTRECSPEDRNYYEVIPEGAASRLYFDLEFKTEINQEKDGPKMVDIFIKYVCHHLKDIYGLQCDRKCIVDLDSSTTSKFSRHLIFHLPGTVFKDNIHAGNFVQHICALLKIKLGFGSETFDKQPAKEEMSVRDCDVTCNLEDLRELLIEDGKGGFATFCDQGVYTKNRNFRIFKSTKIGKNSHLLESRQNTFKSVKDRKGSFSRDPEYLLFLDSLVSNVSMQVGGKDVKVLTCDSCIKSSKNSSQAEAQISSSPTPSQSGFDHSPYPEIDKFISQVINKGGVQGEIRRWVFFPQGKTLTYDILKNRWCENIGRPHKSNHIMIVVDLRLGVYYQKCHDPDCKSIDYRSPERPIPEEINPLSNAKLEEFFYESDESDRELCKVAAECEEMVGEQPNHNSLGIQGSPIITECNREEVNALSSERSPTQDEEALLQVDNLQGVYQSTNCRKTCYKRTLEEPNTNGCRGFLETQDGSNSGRTFNERQTNATTKREQIIGFSENNSSGKMSLENCGSDDKLDFTSDENVSVWLDEDPISDQELSFVAEEVENRS